MDKDGDTALTSACFRFYNVECVQILLEAKSDVNAANNIGMTATHSAAARLHSSKVLQLLINNHADVHAQTVNGVTPAMDIFYTNADLVDGGLSCLQLLLDNKADLNVQDKYDENVLYWSVFYSACTPAAVFAVLSCNASVRSVKIEEEYVTKAKLASCVDEYKQVHAYIDEYHRILNDTLSFKVQVDTRYGLGENGIYQEPLERSLEYLGLRMNKDQVVNASIDGAAAEEEGIKRALIPFNVLNANMWRDKCMREIEW
jgi:hypothetical protein